MFSGSQFHWPNNFHLHCLNSTSMVLLGGGGGGGADTCRVITLLLYNILGIECVHVWVTCKSAGCHFLFCSGFKCCIYIPFRDCHSKVKHIAQLEVD